MQRIRFKERLFNEHSSRGLIPRKWKKKSEPSDFSSFVHEMTRRDAPPPLPFFLSNFQTVTKRKVIDGRTSWVAWQNFARKAASAWQKKERKEREKRKIEEEMRERSSCRPRIINSICHFLGAINDSSRHCWFPPF